MAISATQYDLLRQLPVKHGGSLLEIGEANWYGDLDPESVGLPRGCQFETAKAFYRQWFDPSRLVAIDNNGTESALRRDLNLPIELGERFDVVINNGTAEHVFNLSQVFSTMHDHCEQDGWLIHDAPFCGWIDHGFYCLQPTLFYDLAMANCYEVHSLHVHESRSRVVIRLDSRDHAARLAEAKRLPQNSMLLAVLRKRVDSPFRYPRQGYYAGTLSTAGARAWEQVR